MVVVLLARRGRSTSWPTLAWLGVFGAIGVYAIRGVAWWPLGAVVAVAGMLAVPAIADATPLPPARIERRRRVNLVVAGLLVAVCLLLLPAWRPIDPRIGAPDGVVGDAPPGITQAIRELAPPGGRIFNPQPWGSWFEFALPGNPVAIDSRIEVFPVQVWDDFDRVRTGVDGWQSILKSWEIALVVAEHDDTAFVDRLIGAGWRDAYHDADGTILIAPGR
jgi:hypothetical protein